MYNVATALSTPPCTTAFMPGLPSIVVPEKNETTPVGEPPWDEVTTVAVRVKFPPGAIVLALDCSEVVVEPCETVIVVAEESFGSKLASPT